MGHERIGFLPHSKQWEAIVEQLSSFDGNDEVVLRIAEDTLAAIQKTYEAMPYDDSVIKAISYLTTLVFSANQENQVDYLNKNGFTVDSNISLFSLIASAQKYITTDSGSLEINKIARDAVSQAVIDYQQLHQSKQLSLFSEKHENVWLTAGAGAAYCELARTFFASFTDRQIKYYIERVAASSIDNYKTLNSFSNKLTLQSNAIADHAFEISKIMQSFAAGWFNNNAVSSLPSREKVQKFLQMSFGKLREELRREADSI